MSELVASVAVVKLNHASDHHGLYVSPRDFGSTGTSKVRNILKGLNLQRRARDCRNSDGINIPLTDKPNLNINVHEQSIRPTKTRIKKENMSNLPGNPFAEDHDQMYHDIGDTVVAEIGQTDATLIWSAIENHATATLALAYEQRTANLIAVATAVSENGVYQLDPALIGAAQEEIASRLGLGGNNA